jgi:diguanylate cyclase (GGDEF)-like protein/PAS domain S-box-containing protein
MQAKQIVVLEKLDRIFQQVQEPLFLIDENGRCFYGNQTVLDFLGYTKSEFETLSVWEFSETLRKEDWKEHWDKIRESGFGEMPGIHRKKNGETVDVVITTTALEDDENQWLYVLSRETGELKSLLGCSENSINPDYNVFKHLEEGVALHQIILDEEGNPVDYRFLEVNQAFCALLGFQREKVIGKTVRALLPETPLSLIREYGQVALERQTKNFNYYGEDLGRHWKVHAYSPAAMQFITVFSDITDMVNKQRDLELERERLQMAIDTADLAFLDIEMEGDRVHVQGGIFNKYTIEKIADLDSFFTNIHPIDQRDVAEQQKELLDGKRESFSIEMRFDRGGNMKWIEMNLKIVTYQADGRANRIIGVIKDIHEKKRERQRFEFLANHDVLTDTFNRNAFERYIQRNLPAEQYPVGMLLFDVDGLKLLNDGFGHGEGDLLLTCFAATLKSEFESPARIFRIGGDEFAVIMPKVQAEEIPELQKQIKEKVEAFDLPIQASISSGFGLIESKGELLEDTFREAEDRMYRNKLWEKRRERSSMSETLIKSLQSRTHEDYEHFTRIEEMAMKMADALSLDDHNKMVLRKLAYAHDIGKLATPKEILYKPAELSEEEWEVMRKHSEVGYRIALGLNDLALAASDILLHHEHWDGGGYPHGLKGEDIPLTARVISILDAYDAMTHHRPYRNRFSQAEAIAILHQESGTKFDPELIEIFLNIL